MGFSQLWFGGGPSRKWLPTQVPKSSYSGYPERQSRFESLCVENELTWVVYFSCRAAKQNENRKKFPAIQKRKLPSVFTSKVCLLMFADCKNLQFWWSGSSEKLNFKTSEYLMHHYTTAWELTYWYLYQAILACKRSNKSPLLQR